MRRGIALSAFGLGTTSPNPPVGCVILDTGGRIVGEGYHRRKGEPHAEVNALRAAGERARGGTAVVTLEPCNHHGRTPPCRQALIDAGISRVLVAVLDPTSREEGGAARLRAAGLDVETEVLADETRVVLRPWLHALSVGRPHVHVTYALTESRYTELDATGLATMRSAVDAVVLPDGQIEEGVRDGHAPDVFSLPPSFDSENSVAALTDLYQRGVRSVLLVGHAPALLEERLVDELTVYLSQQRASQVQDASTAAALIPCGFYCESVVRTPDHVQLVLRDDASASEAEKR